MVKRYSLEFDIKYPELDTYGLGGCYNHLTGDYDKYHCGSYWRGNSLKTMKSYIYKIRKQYAELKPHNFRIYDIEAPEESDGHMGQVYFEP